MSYIKKLLFVAVFNSTIVTSILAQKGFWNDFSDTNIEGWKSSAANAFTPSVKNNVLEVVAATGGFNNLEYVFPAQDISHNPKLRIKIKSPAKFTMRIDLKDANGKFTNVQLTSNEIAQSTNQIRYVFDFNGKFTSPGVDPKKIVQMTFFFNPGGNFNGTVTFDDLVLGDSVKLEIPTPGGVIVNQIGYERVGPKTGILQTDVAFTDTLSFSIINSLSQVVLKKPLGINQTVPGWQKRFFRIADFSSLTISGKYRLKIGTKVSAEFEIGDNLLFNKTAFSQIDFFKSMRSTDERDKNLPFYDTRPNANVYGGWKDASGDPGKHMSHLSYANYFNPQQIPLVTWSILKSYELNKAAFATKEADLLSEAAWGADYTMRNIDPAGYLYIAIFDDWGGSFNRQICEWGLPGFDSGRSANYQAAMREGAGVAIASLARASRMNLTAGTFTPANYLVSAEKLYNHLNAPGTGYKTKNIQYCNDHKENIIDWYCGLLASTELFKTTKNISYLTDSRAYLDKIIAVQNPVGYLASDSLKTRPFNHAADEGFPVISALELASIDEQSSVKINTFLTNWIKWYKNVSREVTNPFNYVRQIQRAYLPTGGLQPVKTAFFVQHKNETGYWWQGENARLASMSAALILAQRQVKKNYNFGTDSISALAEAQMDWIAGKNPYGICMLHGYGVKNYPLYNGKPNYVGGICNGITSDDLTENDLASAPYDNSNSNGDAWQNWRWIEQWLPHNAWWLLSVSAVSNNVTNTYTDCNKVVGGEAFVDSCGKCAGGNTGNPPINTRANCGITGFDFNDSDNRNGLTVFPNPASNSVKIQFNDLSHFSVKFIDMNGNQVFNNPDYESGQSISLHNITPGIYSLTLTHGNQVKKAKFAVVR